MLSGEISTVAINTIRCRISENLATLVEAAATSIRQSMETTLRELSDLGFAKGEKIPWASTLRTCRQVLNVAPALWTFLEHPEVEPTNNAAAG